MKMKLEKRRNNLMENMLEIKDLHVYYDNIHALKGISLNVKQGEIVSLIGANGAGKTTTGMIGYTDLYRKI